VHILIAVKENYKKKVEGLGRYGYPGRAVKRVLEEEDFSYVV